LLTCLLLVAITAAWLFQGYVRHDVGHAGTAGRGPMADAGLTGAGAVLDLRGSTPLSDVAPRGEVALTFDDGPDARWTPAILQVLARHHVPATFFVVGSRVLEHPELVQKIRRQGHELGVHTFTHVDVAAVSPTEVNLQLSLTESAVAGAVGIRPVLFRPPYSSTPASVTTAGLAAYQEVARHGYLIALADFDSGDWRRDGTGPIVARATPPNGRGGVVLFHDGGGDRSETVAAVDALVTNLQEQGYRFVTVSDLAGLSAADVEPSASRVQRLQGELLQLALTTAETMVKVVVIILPIVGLLAVLRTMLLVPFARKHRRRHARGSTDPPFLPPVTIVVPVYNEEVGVARAVRSLARSDYPDVDVVVVDDGSTDRTAEVVRSLDLPNVALVTQPNRGKPAALQTGIAAARSEILVMVDGDTLFEPDTLERLVQPFVDPAVGAVAGNTKVANRRGLLGSWQHIEYVMGFNLDRRMYEELRCMPTVPGAIGAFRKEALDSVGGVSDDTLAEDTDLTMAIGRAGWRVAYEEDARAWTEAPATMKALWKQRYRWSYGTMQAMWKHRGALRPSARSTIGRRALPYMLAFQIVLPLLAPLIDLFAIYGLLFLDRRPVLLVWAGFTALQLIIGCYAFHLDRERWRPLLTMPLQQIVYRQMLYLVVLHSAVTAVLGVPVRWHKLHRTGDFSAASTAASRTPSGRL